ncbi:MAG TPA: NAD-dependent epimerase/dehydratase family protein [Agriterribacter sp.]|nr:NAD-dependent epimerase/dehydratase family protein [Agriterribacter sp.]
MVIGNGLVARAFDAYRENNRYVIFASGVSDSTNLNAELFNRERELLMQTLEQNEGKVFVYFSTCSVYDNGLKETAYVKHKLMVEKIIAENHKHYFIFRVSNLAGHSTNTHTVLNFFVQHILSGDFFYLWKNAHRNIIDIDDAFAICNHTIMEDYLANKIINVANPVNYSVLDIVAAIERFTGKKGNYAVVEKYSLPEIDVSVAKDVIDKLNITFDENYLTSVINKYFATNDLQTGKTKIRG